MDIKTEFGICKNVKVEPYCEDGVFILGYINENDDSSYDLLGFDAPIKDDPVWRFWVESSDSHGAAETNKAELSDEDKIVIQNLYSEYCLKNEKQRS